MPASDDELSDYEVGFTVAPDPRPKPITRIGPGGLFYGARSEDVVFKVRAEDADEAEEKAVQMLTGPDYVRRFGPGFEYKLKYIWKIMYL